MNWLKRLFLDEDRFWIFATVFLTAVSVRRGFRRPIFWAATQAQIDYSHGFVKRGLFGAVATRFLQLQYYGRFALVSTLLLVVLVVLFVVFGKRTGMVARCGSMMPVAVFGASYPVMFLSNLNGYMDIPLGILTVGLLMVRSVWKRALLAVPVVVAAILIHEMFLLVFLPVVVLSFLLQGMFSAEKQVRVAAILSGVGIAVLAVGVTVGISLRASASSATVRAMEAEITQRVDFPLDQKFFDVLTRSTADNLTVMKDVSRQKERKRGQITASLILLPLAALLLSMVYRLLSLSASGWRRWMAFAGCVVASLMPISMNALGWDAGRWYALAGVAAFLVLGAVCLYVPGPMLDGLRGFERAAVLVIALSMTSDGGLVEGSVRPYPFISPHPPVVPGLVVSQQPGGTRPDSPNAGPD